MTALCVGLVVGSRPELFHLAPLSHACSRRSDVEINLIVSQGLRNSLAAWELPAPVLTINERLSPEETPTAAWARQLTDLDGCWSVAPPDCVVIQGSSPLAFAAALAASALQIPVIHVDPLDSTHALPRSIFSGYARRSTGWLAAMHCVASRQLAQSLIHAGSPRHTVFITGHTAVDSWRSWIAKSQQPEVRWSEPHAWLLARPYVVCDLSDLTPCSVNTTQCWQTMDRLAFCHPDVQFVVIMPTEQSDQTQLPVKAMNLQSFSTTSLVEIAGLKARSRLIISCSPLWREEQLAFRVPVVDWDGKSPTAEPLNLLERCGKMLGHPLLIDEPGVSADGRAAQRIVDLLAARAWNEPMTVRRAA